MYVLGVYLGSAFPLWLNLVASKYFELWKGFISFLKSFLGAFRFEVFQNFFTFFFWDSLLHSTLILIKAFKPFYQLCNKSFIWCCFFKVHVSSSTIPHLNHHCLYLLPMSKYIKIYCWTVRQNTKYAKTFPCSMKNCA